VKALILILLSFSMSSFAFDMAQVHELDPPAAVPARGETLEKCMVPMAETLLRAALRSAHSLRSETQIVAVEDLVFGRCQAQEITQRERLNKQELEKIRERIRAKLIRGWLNAREA
jgi:hypothetical protein